jgi:hypothetical protein
MYLLYPTNFSTTKVSEYVNKESNHFRSSIQAGHLRSQITIELCQERLPAKSFELTSIKNGSTAKGHDGVVTRRSNFENN